MTNQIAPGAATARENARTAAGQFGVQPRSEAELELVETPAPDPMTWLPKTGQFGDGWEVVSESYDDDDMEATTTYRPDPATAAQLRGLLGVSSRASVRVQRHTVAPSDYNTHVDEIEATAAGQEFYINADYSGDAGVKLMETLAFRQAPPVAEQAAALAGARPGGNVVVLRSVPSSDMPPAWDRATVQVIGVEDGELLVAPERPGASHRGRVPERIPLDEVGVLDRASAVKSRPSLAWSKGYWSAQALDEINEAEFLRRQAAARQMPEHDWTSRFEVISSDHEHGIVPDEVKEVYTGEMIGFATYDLTTLDPDLPRDRRIIEQQVKMNQYTAGHIGREIGVLDEEPDEAKIDELAQRMHQRDLDSAEYVRRSSDGKHPQLPGPTVEQYAGYLRATVADYLA